MMTNTKEPFRNHLEEMFCAQYRGLDDEMPDAEDEWFAALDPYEVIDWAEEFAAKRYAEGIIKGKAMAFPIKGIMK